MARQNTPRRVKTTLRLARIATWHTTYAMARLLGCHQSTYSMWECRSTPCSNPAHRHRLVEFLGLSEEVLFGPDHVARLWLGEVPAGYPTTVKGLPREFPSIDFGGSPALATVRGTIRASLHDLEQGDLDLCLAGLELAVFRLRRLLKGRPVFQENGKPSQGRQVVVPVQAVSFTAQAHLAELP